MTSSPDPKVVEEAEANFLSLLPHIQSHTGQILPCQVGERRELTGQGSCVFVSLNGRKFAVTCAHVLRGSGSSLIGASVVRDAAPPLGTPGTARSVSPTDTDERADLAAFEMNWFDPAAASKESYRLDGDVSPIGFEVVSRNLGTASFIGAVPGAGAGLGAGLHAPPSPGVLVTESPVYSAYGPIVGVTDDLIVANFAERANLAPPAGSSGMSSPITLSGGARDIRGMSGSGLWGKGKTGPVLLGILLRKASDNDDGAEHRICFRPIWKVVEWLSAIAAG